MAVNSAFKTSGFAATTGEQNLYADLVKEAIQIHGHDVNYIWTFLFFLFFHSSPAGSCKK